MANSFILVMVTCASKKEAQLITNSLLKKHVVACANIIFQVKSKFWWKGKINNATEVLVIMKTKKVNFKKIQNEVKKLHSYEVPEIIALPIIDANIDYLNWITKSTG